MSEAVDGRVRRGQQSRELRRMQLKQAALGVFAERGYASTTIAELIQAAGVARGTFYLYFESKEVLFLELLDDLIAELRAGIRGVDARAGAPSVREQLPGVLARVLGVVAANRSLTRILFREPVGLDAAVDSRLSALDAQLHEYVASALTRGRRLGVVRDGFDVDVAARCVVGGVRQVLQREVVARDDERDLDALARDIVGVYLDGVGG